MARKKRTSKKTSKTKKTRGKKRRREWSKVTFDELDAWRAARNIPKKRMAEMLSVTNSTYHNWARGIAVATPNTQERIRKVIDQNGSQPGNNAKGSNPNPSDMQVMETTGQIVASYLETRPSGMTTDKLVKLVREVRRALVE